MTPENKLAFLGVGLMGAPMAERILASGRQLHVWNRSSTRLSGLQAKGAIVAESAAASAAGASVVILMFDTANTTRHVLFETGVADALAPGAIVVDMSSNDPQFARDCARRLADKGIAHLDAPVSGGTAGAIAGTLAIMVGGGSSDFERVKPLFDAMGRATRVGSGGAGQYAKLANQIIVAVTIGAVSEALLFARAGGAELSALREALTGGFADSLILQLHGRRMIERLFEPGGSVANQIKDLDAVDRITSEIGLQLPLLSNVRSAFRGLVEQGDQDKDHSALFLWLERLNASVRKVQSPSEGAGQ